MVSWQFDYEARMIEIEQNLQGYTQIKQLSENPLVSVSEGLVKTLENALVVSVYSLSEQLLKDTVYSILDVTFEEEDQTHKDRYILKQMEPSKYPMTPTIDRIRSELRVYSSNFKLYMPEIVRDYKEAYIQLLNARHEYAHANNHTENIDFRNALKFIQYLKVHYQEFDQRDGYIAKLKELVDILKKINNKDTLQTFKTFLSGSQNSIDQLISEIEQLSDREDKYDIEYLNDIFNQIIDIYENLSLAPDENSVEYADDGQIIVTAEENFTSYHEDLKSKLAVL